MKIYYCRESEFVLAGKWNPKARVEPMTDLLDLQVYKDDRFTYEFIIEEWSLAGNCVRLCIYNESFEALADCAALLDWLRKEKPTTLDQVQAWLNDNGALNNLHFRAPGDSPDPLSGRGRAGAAPAPSSKRKGRKA